MSNLPILNVSYNNQTKFASCPNFRGNNAPEFKSDSVEINGREKEKLQKSTGRKLLLTILGIGIAIFAGIKIHRAAVVKQKAELSAELKEIQNLYKEIFGREINAEETKDFAIRYKKIIDFKTDNNDREYCDRLLEEICRDRKTKKPEIKRWVESLQDLRLSNAGMSTAPDGTYIDIYSYNYRNQENSAKSYFESLFHETHHVKQDEMILRTDKEFFIKDILNKFVNNGEGKMYKELLRANNGDKEKTLNKVREMVSEKLDQHWGSLTSFEKNSAEYQEGLRLIEGKKNYKFFGDCKSNEEYKNQIIEKGAFDDGEKAARLFDLLKQVPVLNA